MTINPDVEGNNFQRGVTVANVRLDLVVHAQTRAGDLQMAWGLVLWPSEAVGSFPDVGISATVDDVDWLGMGTFGSDVVSTYLGEMSQRWIYSTKGMRKYDMRAQTLRVVVEASSGSAWSIRGHSAVLNLLP